MNWRARGAVCIVGCAVGGSPALAAPPPADTFTGQVDVVEVEVPVEVRQRDGTSVRGLAAEDFRVLESGRERPIVRFEAIDHAARNEAGAEPGAGAAVAASAARPRHILLLFDLTFATPISVTRARAAARDVVLGALQPHDLVAVATLAAEHGPRLLVTFTPDRAQVARVIDSLSFDDLREARALDPLRFMMPMAPPSSGESVVSREGQGEEIRQDFADSGFEHFRILGEAFERSSRRIDTSRVVEWSRGFAELARFMAAVSGRKQILFFSEGFDGRLLLGRSDFGDQRVQEEERLITSGAFWRVDNDLRFGDSVLLNETNRLLEDLRRADCLVHAIDIGGLRASGEGSAHGRSRGEESLFFLANESGGELFSETNDFSGQIRDALERSTASYLLTITAESVPFDGAWRPLKVEVKQRRGLRVVHRSGWFAPRPFPELHPFERELLAADAIAVGGRRSEIDVSILAAPFRTGQDWVYVPVILEIDGESLLAGMSEATRVDIYAYATTRAGEFRTFFHRELSVDPQQMAGRGWSGIKYYGHFDLEPEDYVIRVLVRDGGRGRVGIARYEVRVPDFTGAAPMLLPPFFLDESTARWTLVRERTASTADGAVVYPFVADGQPFVPLALPQVRARQRLPFCLIGYSLGSAELALEAFLTDGVNEVPVALAAAPVSTAFEGYHQWLGELRPTALPAGRHRVVMVLTEAANGRRVASAEIELHVEL
ncbi:MAG TPA: VWA domain-containing protein [Thermoanaerobaculia bacterium]